MKTSSPSMLNPWPSSRLDLAFFLDRPRSTKSSIMTLLWGLGNATLPRVCLYNMRRNILKKEKKTSHILPVNVIVNVISFPRRNLDPLYIHELVLHSIPLHHFTSISSLAFRRKRKSVSFSTAVKEVINTTQST